MLSNSLSRRSLPLSARAVSRMPIAVPPTARGLSSTPSKSKAETSSTTAPPSKPLYASQSSLPHLPVPTLSSTFAKYLETIVPLQTSSEHSASKKLVNDFLSSPHSEELQKRLQKRAAERDSWLSEWWNEVAYMGYRGRIIPNVSYFYVHKRGLGKGKGQEERAAELVRATVEFKKLVDSELLEPEKGKAGPLCMASYKYLFNAVRVPTSPADIPLAYPPQLAHVVVIRNNRYFKVDTAGRSASQLADAFHKIKSIADSAPGSGLGVLTADDRDVWTEVRRHVMSLSKQNTEAIQTIESAILCVSLDGQDQLPTNEDERAWIYWSGGRNEEKKGHGWNRWFDKHDIIVDENGESGFNGEHSMLDGTPTLRLNEFLLASLEHGKIPLELSEHERNQSPMPEPEEIVFELDQKAKEAIEQSKQGFQDEMSKQQLTMVHFTGYGKNAIKTYKSSPDAWAQMIKQLAFYRHFGRPGVTYESCMTRKYLLGRTEVIRSCSAEALAFVKAMEDPSVSDKERDALYRKAANRHIQYSAWAADGQGVDRHMFGLKMLVDKSKGEEMPAVFKEDVHGKSSHWEMSTSQLSSKWLDGWGYGEVVDDGYGLSYSIDDDSLRWCVTTKNGDAKAFAKRLEQAAEDMRAVMERAKSA